MEQIEQLEQYDIPVSEDEIPAEEPLWSEDDDLQALADSAVFPEEERPTPTKARPAPTRTRRKKPHIAVRIALQFSSFVLSVLLAVGILVSALLIDVRMLTSSGSLQPLIRAFLSTGSSAGTSSATGNAVSPTPQAQRPSPYLIPLSNRLYDDPQLPGDIGGAEIPGGIEIPDDIRIPSDIQIPSDVLTNPSALTDYICEIIQETAGTDVPVTPEQVQQIVDNSTLTDFVSDKVASYIDDAFTGNENTTITVDEIMDLLEENQTLIEETFDITVTDEIKQNIRVEAEKVVEQNDLNGTIRQEINKVMTAPVSDTSSLTVQDILQAIGSLTQNAVIGACLGICLLLLLLLLGANFYNLPMGMTWASFSFMEIGSILCAIVLSLQLTPAILIDLLPQEADFTALLSSLAGIFAPVHYAVAAIGLALLIGSIVWRIVARCIRNAKQRNLAA